MPPLTPTHRQRCATASAGSSPHRSDARARTAEPRTKRGGGFGRVGNKGNVEATHRLYETGLV